MVSKRMGFGAVALTCVFVLGQVVVQTAGSAVVGAADPPHPDQPEALPPTVPAAPAREMTSTGARRRPRRGLLVGAAAGVVVVVAVAAVTGRAFG